MVLMRPGDEDVGFAPHGEGQRPKAIAPLSRGRGFSPGDVAADRFRIVRFIGEGGMGEVYEAEDLELKERVALKTLRPEIASQERTLARFKREIQLSRKVTHPNVCRIFDLARHGETTFLTMELVRGETLAERLRRQGRMSPSEALPIIEQMAAGLQAAHQVGVVHRDFKSANVMLELGAGDLRVVVTDFGLARSIAAGESTATATGGIVGTPAYVAPEQLEGGKITGTADLYALGVVVYEMVTGKQPFVGDSAFAVAVKRLRERPTPPSSHVADLDPNWEGAILRCLERNPAERFSTAAEVVQALRSCQAPRPSRVQRASWLSVPIWAAVCVVMLLGLVVSYYLRVAREQRPATPVMQSRRSVAVLGFKNLSGRAEAAWLSTALSEMFVTELAAGEKLRTIPGENVARMKIELALAEAESFAPDTLRRIKKNLGTDYVVLGSYVLLGEPATGKLRIDLRLQDTASAETLASAVETGGEGDLLELVSRSGARLRTRLGVGEVSSTEAAGIRAAAPANTEAARLYAEGLARLRVFEARAARDLLEKAVAADPRHAQAHAALASAWAVLGYDAKARETGREAFELSGSLSREERLAVEGRYQETAQQWEQAVETYRTLFGFFPDNLDYGLRLAAAQTSLGKGKDALATAEALRKKLPAPARDDPRIDLTEGRAAGTLSDFKRQLAAAAQAAAKGSAQGARLLVAGARLQEGAALERLGQPKEAAAAHEEARRLYIAAGDRAGQARVVNDMAVALISQGRLSEARKMAEESLAIFRGIGAQGGVVASALNSIARILNAQGDFQGAEKLFQQALSTYREVGNKGGEAAALNNIAVTLKSRGDLNGSRRRYEQALAIDREIGNRHGEASTLNNIAIVLHDQGEIGPSKQTFEQALAIYRQIGSESGSAGTTYALGRVLLAQGDLAAARKAYEDSLAMRAGLGEKLSDTFSRSRLAAVTVEEGRAAEAETPAREAAEEFRKQKMGDSEAFVLDILARALLAQGKVVEARQVIERAVPLAAKSPHTLLPVAITAARVRGADGKALEAARSLGGLLAEASRAGLVSYQLEIRLALGEIEVKSGKAVLGRARLEALEKEAAAKGFGLIAGKAAAARQAR